MKGRMHLMPLCILPCSFALSSKAAYRDAMQAQGKFFLAQSGLNPIGLTVCRFLCQEDRHQEMMHEQGKHAPLAWIAAIFT